jgi:hypothetical protein
MMNLKETGILRFGMNGIVGDMANDFSPDFTRVIVMTCL